MAATIRSGTKLERIRRLLESPNAHIRQLVGLLHPTELAQVLENCDEDTQTRIIRQLPRELISEAIAEMDEEARPGELLTRIHPRAAAGLLAELEADDAADLLSQIEEEKIKERILYYMAPEEGEVINRLMTYDEYSAGGLMNPDVVKVRAGISSFEAIREVARQSEEIENFFTIYVVDEDERLVGILRFKALFRSRRDARVREVMDRNVISVPADMYQEEVAKLMQQYNLPTLPVVDQHNRLLGSITFDDIMDVIEEENTADLLSFAGVSEDANLRGGWWESVRSRMPWLLVNLCTAAFAGFVVSRFESTLEKFVIIAAYMPIIAGVAGNSATQTLAITLRRISTDGIPMSRAWRVVMKEMGVALVNGLSLALIISAVAVLGQQDLRLGLVIFMSMAGNVLLGGIAGSSVPIALERIGVDPAVASSVFITAFTDVMGFTLLLGLTTWIML